MVDWSAYLGEQAKKCKTSQGAAILLALKGKINGIEVIEGCQEAWQIADNYFLDRTTIVMILEHEQCHSCVYWECAKELGSFCNNKLVRTKNLMGGCEYFSKKNNERNI